MEAIVLAGGFGTRLRQAVPDLPKSMAPIAGKPFLEILLGSLSRKRIHRVVLSLGYMADKVLQHFGSRFAGMDLVYAVEESPLGTGGAVRLAMAACLQDHVFVFNGDTYLDLEIDAVECQWQANGNPIIVGCAIADTARYGRLSIDRNRVVGFEEKGTAGAGLINAGCYVLNRGQLDAFPSRSAFSLEADYLAQAVSNLPFDLFVTSGAFLDIGVPEDYARARVELANV